MPHRFKGERTLMRVFIGESDKALSGIHAGRPLYEALVQTFRERGFAGATVTRAIAGFGASQGADGSTCPPGLPPSPSKGSPSTWRARRSC